MAAINLPIVSKFIDKGVKDAQGAFGGLGKTLGKLGGAIAAAFSVTAITNFTKESILAAEGVATANARIDQIAKSMNIFGDQTQAVADRLKAYAEANELTVAVDAEVIKATQAKLLTFKELAQTADAAGGSFDRATAAAIDLAAAGFGSAETNAVQLGKALNDPIKGITALTRSGITFTQAERDKIKTLTQSGKVLEAQNMILTAIETQVGGTAEATANASDKMKIAFNNLKETVGAALIPVFNTFAESLFPIIEDLAPQLGEVFEGLTPLFTEVANVIPQLIKAFTPLIDVFTDVIVIVAKLAVQIFPILVAIIEALLPIISDLLPIFADLLKDIITPLAPAIVKVVKGFEPLIEALLPVLVQLLRTILPVFTDLLLKIVLPLAPAIVKMVDAFVPLLTQILPPLTSILTTLVIPAFQLLTGIMVGVVNSGINVLQSGLSTLLAFMGPFATAFKGIWSGISSFIRNIIQGILGFVQGFTNGIIDGINAAIKAINSIKVTVPSWVPVVGGNKFGFNLPTLGRVQIPQLADGGIVMPEPGGVLANLAEAGRPEAVIPLDRLGDFGGSTNNYSITVNAGMGSDGTRIGEQIVNEILKFERSSGRVFARA